MENQQKPTTIIDAWWQSYAGLFNAFGNDAAKVYQHLNTDNYDKVVGNFRPTQCYAAVFGEMWEALAEESKLRCVMFKICDVLDEQMFTMFETWATEDLRKQYEKDVAAIRPKWVINFGRNDLDEYEDPALQVAFDVWKKAKGI